ncbi:hypothetical protein LL998_10905 [Burkholderia ambifaria]|uniref:hypothetical protein n=1 Tax=Burkholderia ambifaria TaxID=152480 RepID=UPI001E3533FA|nr:hypothetical protein [Burkholderia ambifaria]UEP33723.1 hypothetical protein LL998_10905 [Burkholderia ambifaria]
MIDQYMQLGLTDKANMKNAGGQPDAALRKAAIEAAGPASSMGHPVSITVKDATGATLVRTMQPDEYVSYLCGFGF